MRTVDYAAPGRGLALIVTAALLTAASPAAGGSTHQGLIREVLERLEHDRDALRHYSFKESSLEERRGRNGDLRDMKKLAREIFYERGQRMQRPLPTEPNEPDPADPPSAVDEPALDLDHLVSCYRFEPIGPERLAGRPVVKVAFSAVDSCLQEKGRTARILRNLRGEMWIDREDSRLLRLSGRLQRPVDYGFGILARLESFEVTLQREQVAPGVFATTRLEYQARGRTFPARRFDVRATRERTTFRRIRGRDASDVTSSPTRPPASDPDPRHPDRS